MVGTLLLVIVVIVAGLWALPKGYNTEDFPYPDACWSCNKGNCHGCIIRR